MLDGFSIELDDSQLLSAINGLIDQLEHPHALMEDIGAHIERAAQQRFDAKIDPAGKPWAPLSPATIDIYGSDWFKALNPDFKDGIPGSLLQRTNALRRSLTHNAGDTWVDIGTTRPTKGGKWQVGWLHETGTRKMPRRGFLTADPIAGTLAESDQAAVLRLVSDYISGAL